MNTVVDITSPAEGSGLYSPVNWCNGGYIQRRVPDVVAGRLQHSLEQSARRSEKGLFEIVSGYTFHPLFRVLHLFGKLVLA